MVVGVNGVGKTTTIGKLAYNYRNAGYKVLIGAADTFRAAANEQLEIWAERAGVEIIGQGQGADPAAVAYDTLQAAISRNADVVIIDTAGRLHTKTNLMEELQKMSRVMKKIREHAPNEVFLVLDATTGQNAIQQAKEFMRSVEITGLVLTKLDGTAKGGVVIAIANTLEPAGALHRRRRDRSTTCSRSMLRSLHAPCSPSRKPSRRMNRGCIVAAIVVAIAVGIAGYFAYMKVKQALDTPKELLPYANPDSMSTRLSSHDTAPPAGSHLTPNQIRLFMGALDSINTGWSEMKRAFDSMHLTSKSGGDTAKIDLWASPYFLQQFNRMPLLARRGLTNYLNDHRISWAEYLWIKDRMVAASGVTRHDLDSALKSKLEGYFQSHDTTATPGDTTARDTTVTKIGADSTETFFRHIDSLRTSGAIDSTEQQLVIPYRDVLLDQGILCLLGIETNFELGFLTTE